MYSIALCFSCHGFCEKIFSLYLGLKNLFVKATHILFCFNYQELKLCKVIHFAFWGWVFHMCWNHFESIISRRYSLSFRCFLLTASEPSWVTRQSIYFSEVELCSSWAFWKQICNELLVMKPVGFLKKHLESGLLTSNDSSLADCKGAGDTIKAEGSYSEGR